MDGWLIEGSGLGEQAEYPPGPSAEKAIGAVRRVLQDRRQIELLGRHFLDAQDVFDDDVAVIVEDCPKPLPGHRPRLAAPSNLAPVSRCDLRYDRSSTTSPFPVAAGWAYSATSTAERRVAQATSRSHWGAAGMRHS